jgi:hypothetical protein
MTTTTPSFNPDVPIPAGFSADGDWADTQTPRPWRTIWGAERKIDDAHIRLSALQYVDGVIDTDSDGPAIHVHVMREWGISTTHAREVAAAILVAADEADRLVAE